MMDAKDLRNSVVTDALSENAVELITKISMQRRARRIEQEIKRETASQPPRKFERGGDRSS
jgi:hypothetical protein